ncbi:MarR family winged helix-turn-helix transcriptional regulator [Nonomuraea roseola]|uniref:MarR family winged helix-turn-helix transcriptional regulator n=1 Tax=Nonomuraea roseola TaxID=46179 RepID=A0ABV5QFQ0_9ACTN
MAEDLLAQARALTSPLYDLARALRFSGVAEAGLYALPPSELEVLRYVVQEPGVGLTALARALGMQASNVSATVRSLVGRDLVTREPDPADRRSVRLKPTVHALHGMALIEGAWAEIFAAALADLSPSQRESFTAAIPAMVALAEALKSRR